MAFEKYYLEFDGTQLAGMKATAPRFNGYDFSIEFRARVPVGGLGGGTLFDAFDESVSAEGRGIKITLDNTGRPTILVADGYATRTRTATGVFVAGTWYHYVFSFMAAIGPTWSRWYIDTNVAGDWVAGVYSEIKFISGPYHIGVNYNEDTSMYENYFTGDILLFGYYVGHALTQDEVTTRYNYWNFHRGTDYLSWGSNIDDGVGYVATDVLGGERLTLPGEPVNPTWHLYGVYADPVFELWRDWDDIISMCLLPFGSIAIAAQVIVAACTDTSGESYYDYKPIQAETKYDATALYLSAIDAAEYTPVYADSKYDATGAYFSAIDYDEIYIGHKFLGE